MAGSLIKIAETTVSSAVSSVTLTGIDSTYDVYMVKISGLIPVSDSFIQMRVTESGTPNTTANYDEARKGLNSDIAFQNFASQNSTSYAIMGTIDSTTSGTGGGAIIYLFNFNNATEYSFGTSEEVHLQGTLITARGVQGGFVFTSTSTCDGVSIFGNSSNIASGKFSLYGLKK
jgi:hypothetical protein